MYKGLEGVAYFLMGLSAVAGWAVIELILWLLSHVTIGISL